MPLYKGAGSILEGAQIKVDKRQDYLFKALIGLTKLPYS
jgi:hypothetical protein